MSLELAMMQPASITTDALGWWISDGPEPDFSEDALEKALLRLGRPVFVLDAKGRTGVATFGSAAIGNISRRDGRGYCLRAFAPALRPEQLGDAEFREAHGLRYAYVGGGMAHGISSEELVEALGRAGMIGFFGSAGLSLERIGAAIDRIQRNLGDAPWGMNLIHSPNEPAVEAGTVDLYLRKKVRLVSAAAYLSLTLPLVRFRVTGIHRNSQGEIVAPNGIIAKVSRVEVARRFFSPPPAEMLQALVESNAITAEQAALAQSIPMAQDLTAEADSAGHTDNRPALALLPAMLALRDEMQKTHGYPARLRVGLGGGIATPASAAAAFAMGAAYVLTGTVNQACTESGTSRTVKEMLAKAGQADTIMAPAADMFEMGVKVQVLKWSTLFPMRAKKLYEIYLAHDGLEHIPTALKAQLERDYFHCSLEKAWEQTEQYFQRRDPQQITRANAEPKYKLALLFRAYLGQTSKWAIAGDPARKSDYQIWCGPSIGAFNEWVKGTFLEVAENRKVATVAMNILAGAAVLTRAASLRNQNVVLTPRAQSFAPREMPQISELLQ